MYLCVCVCVELFQRSYKYYGYQARGSLASRLWALPALRRWAPSRRCRWLRFWGMQDLAGPRDFERRCSRKCNALWGNFLAPTTVDLLESEQPGLHQMLSCQPGSGSPRTSAIVLNVTRQEQQLHAMIPHDRSRFSCKRILLWAGSSRIFPCCFHDSLLQHLVDVAEI